MRIDRADESIAAADQALSIAERRDLERLVAEAFNNKASSLGFKGRRRESIALLEAAVRVAEAGGFVAAELRARTNLASMIVDDDVRAAAAMNASTLELARRVGNQTMANWVLGQLLFQAFLSAADWDERLAAADEQIAGGLAAGDEAHLLWPMALMRAARDDQIDELIARLEGLVAELADPARTAADHVPRAHLALVRGELETAYAEGMAGSGMRSVEAPSLGTAGRAALRMGDLDRARDVSRRLDAMANPDRTDRAFGTMVRAGVAALEGRVADAIAGHRETIRDLTGQGLRYPAAQDGLQLGLLLGVSDPIVRGLVEEAREVFVGVRATPYVKLADEVLAGARAPIAPPTGVGAAAPGEAAARSSVGSSAG
jgi:tetratricopeptide (TPR) repeat protein